MHKRAMVDSTMAPFVRAEISALKMRKSKIKTKPHINQRVKCVLLVLACAFYRTDGGACRLTHTAHI
jgi:hypothetical protein